MAILKSSKAVTSSSVSTASYTDTELATASETETDNETYILCTDGRYVNYSNYSDTAYSTVDDLKNVVVDETQINITQEINSQYIPFKISRYWDGIDLMDMLIQIHWKNSKDKGDISNAVNVSYSTSHITFGWLITEEVTSIKGDVEFEITATGLNEKGAQYKWRTRPNGKINIIEALEYSGIVQPSDDWYTSFETMMSQYVSEAKTAATEAKEAVASIDTDTIKTEVESAIKEDIDKTVASSVSTKFTNYYTKSEVDKLDDQLADSIDELKEFCESIDSLSQLQIDYDNTTGVLTLSDKKDDTTTTTIGSVTINSLSNLKVTYAVTNGKGTLTFSNGDTEITSVEIGDVEPSDEWTASLKEEIETTINTNLTNNYYTKTTTDTLLAKKATSADLSNLSASVDTISDSVSTNKTNITTLSNKLISLEDEVNSIDKSPRKTYEATYDEEYIYTLWEIEGEGDDEVRTAKSSFKIAGGSGSSTSSVLKIEYVTKTPIVATTSDTILITYKFSGTDSSGDSVLEGTATWRVGSTTVATSTALDGENTFDITNYIALGTQKVTLSITDEAGSLVTKTWTVQKIDVRLESSFNDQLTYPLGSVAFDYTPYGAVSKVVHFILDGTELDSVTTTSSGIPMAYTLPSQTHGSHLLDVYMTAVINNNTVESNHITKDILWFDSTSTVPVIGCTTTEISMVQYDTMSITYTVYDPTEENPTVSLAIDGETISTLELEDNTQVWQYKPTEVGTYTLTITCGVTVKTITVTVTELDIDVEPVTAGLQVDFNPVGYSNSDSNKLWTNGTVSMSVSDNFDWTNGGYQIDDDGDQYFCIKAGTTATFDYKLFEDDAKKNGKEFKLIYEVTNVRNASATFLTCYDELNTSQVGVKMNVHEAYIYAGTESLELPYSEDDIIEFEFNISKDTDDIPMIMGYEDGVATRPLVYGSSHSFTQNDPQIITIGSDDCDVHIYRMKIYNAALTDRGILNNFIADARSADEMISRYNRNQIYDENGSLTPETLAEKCPDLRVIVINAPWFTNDKKDKVTGTTIQMIYKNGDAVYDNWTAYNCMHSGRTITCPIYMETYI